MAWSVLQCAVQGRGHLASGTPCQDKTYSIVMDGCTVSALADGAGSAQLSHFGADAVTKAICEFIAKNFDYILADGNGVNVKREILVNAGNCLQKLGKKLKSPVKELASTLLFVAEKSGMFVICHIGDGVVGYVKEGKVLVASHPENGEFANTTVFTTSPNALATMKLIKGRLNQISSFVLMSDGTENSFYNKREGRLSQSLAKLSTLASVCDGNVMSEKLRLAFEGLVKQKTSDDCSMVLMAKAAPGRGYPDLPEASKCQILNLPKIRKSVKRLDSFDSILDATRSWQSPKAIARRLHMHQHKVERSLRRLNDAGLADVREDGRYKSTLR